VTEGYATAPSFFKSYSTGDVFCSANDTLRDIFLPASSGATETLVSPRKRTRSHSDQGYDEDQGIAEDDEDAEMASDEEQRVGRFPMPPGTAFARPMKPLRRTPRKGIMITHSLPGGSMRHLEGKATSDEMMDEEKDWSIPDVQVSSGPTAFEPMIFS
jgi:hypothetical protein